MTAAIAIQEPISVEEYLNGELASETRHEYANGQVFAMAGATVDHDVVKVNLTSLLHQHLKGNPCRVFSSDMKLKLELNHADLFYYPDLMVVCESEDTGQYFKVSPRVLVEVMSDFKKDHVEKLFAYQQVASLEEYLVVDQDPANPRAWIYRRSTGWRQDLIAPGQAIALSSIGFESPLEGLYEV